MTDGTAEEAGKETTIKRNLKKLDPAMMEKSRAKAAQLDVASGNELPRELLNSVTGGADDEIPIGKCPRCSSTLYLA